MKGNKYKRSKTRENLTEFYPPPVKYALLSIYYNH